jgi:transcriptional regulator with XRE-family HTH domain
MKRLHEKLERARAARGIPQAELVRVLAARGLGGNRAQMSRWFSGAAVPDLAETAAMAAYLGVSLDYLVDDAQDEPAAGLSPEDIAVLRVARGLLVSLSLDEVVTRLVTELDDARLASVRAAGRARPTELGPRPGANARPDAPELPRVPFRTEVSVNPAAAPPAPATPRPAPGTGGGSPRRSRGRSA